MKKVYSILKRKIAATIVLLVVATTTFAQTDVLVCGAASPQSWLDDVQNKLVATGAFNSVTTYNTYSTGTPTLAYLQTFDAVLVYTDYGPMDPTTLGNNLAAYIDGGGGVVNCVFSNASVVLGGNFNTTTYQVIVPNNGQNSSPTLTLGTILNTCHPIMQGINSFNGGSSSYRSSSNTLAPGASFIANWSNGDWLVAEKTNVGPANARRADLNFYPPSSTVRSDFWDAGTQGGQIMANALLWVAGVTNMGNPPATPGSVSGSSAICEGTTTTYSIASVAAATSYTWAVPSGSVIQSGQGTTSITVLAGNTSGNITVTADNNCGSSPAATFTLTINTLPTVSSSASPSSTVCSGDSVILSGSGAMSYTWSGGITDAVAFAASVSATYTVTGTDANGCVNTNTHILTVNPLPTVTAASTAGTVCSGDTVTLTGSGASTYTWTGAVTDNVAFNPTITDTYTVTGTDGNGCMNTDTITVTVNPLPSVVANATATAVCSGDSVVLSGSGASAYSWTGSVTDNVSFVPSITDTYTVTGTDANGCMNSDEITVTVNANPTVVANATSTVVCEGSPVTLSGSGATIYTWTGSVTDNVAFTPAATDTYTVTGTDANGCMDSDEITVTVNALPTVSASSSSTAVCLDDAAATLTGSPVGGTWSGPGVTGSSFDPMSAGVGAQTVSYTYTDGNGCEATGTTTITVNACTGVIETTLANNVAVYPNPNSGEFTISVNANVGDLNIEILDMQGRVVYAAQENNLQAGFTSRVSLSGMANGIYMVRLTSADAQQMIKVAVQE